MERKTYYRILGVSSTESDAGIRAAYRGLAKRLHPDVAGQEATRSFQEVSEAYGVLSDPERRAEYNHELERASDGGLVRAPASSPEFHAREPVTSRGDRDGLRSSFAPVYGRFLRHFTGVGVPRSGHPQRLDVDVLLTPEEASRGCVVPVDIPVLTRCTRCRGSGHDGVFACAHCHQRGMIEKEGRLQIRIVPMSPSGSIYEIPLQGLGIHNIYLRLRVFVEARPG